MKQNPYEGKSFKELYEVITSFDKEELRKYGVDKSISALKNKIKSIILIDISKINNGMFDILYNEIFDYSTKRYSYFDPMKYYFWFFKFFFTKRDSKFMLLTDLVFHGKYEDIVYVLLRNNWRTDEDSEYIIRTIDYLYTIK